MKKADRDHLERQRIIAEMREKRLARQARWEEEKNEKKGEFFTCFVCITVDQLMFAAINVRVLANWSISPAINVRDFWSQ